MLEKSNNQSLKIYTWLLKKTPMLIFSVNDFIHF